MLTAQVHVVTWFAQLRHRLAVTRDDERGDAYSSTIMVAVGVAIAIAVGVILMAKFTGKAESIDTDTPTSP